MPLVLLVPSCRGNYNGCSSNLTFVSIVKTIMAMSFLAQTKTNRYVTQDDQLSVLSAKEWDIGLQKNLLTFRVYKSFFKDDLNDDVKAAIEDESKFTGGH